ncbi:response regulator [Croceitalea vernalis]|uniref:Response regulator transcription factor n=1 Tax=Croceitalea vernalis TaxID=3075599 RepID=A0ABU3BD95_9FLAO|nr:response regulator transcription factor [Croceitalea sp. P007]MDT0620434.1 response regulator transcription factor [Croceitalea sp. P007]
MRSKQIFLVDDDEIFRTAAEILISTHFPDFEIIHFENGLEVYERLLEIETTQSSLPQIMLLDINMPVMNGWELLEELKNHKGRIKNQVQIHISTSSIAPQDMNLSKTYDFIKGYIRKPITSADLKHISESLLV